MVREGNKPGEQGEAAVMASNLVEYGVAAAATEQDRHSDNALATAKNTARLLAARAANARVVVVTQWLHVPRTMLAMRRSGLNVSAARSRFAEGRGAYSLAREAVALPICALKPWPGKMRPTPIRQSPIMQHVQIRVWLRIPAP